VHVIDRNGAVALVTDYLILGFDTLSGDNFRHTGELAGPGCLGLQVERSRFTRTQYPHICKGTAVAIGGQAFFHLIRDTNSGKNTATRVCDTDCVENGVTQSVSHLPDLP